MKGPFRFCLLAAAWWLAGGAVVAQPPRPDAIEGLEAWYRADALSRAHNSGDPVAVWPDETANEHHLTSDDNGQSAVFHAAQVGDLPAVQIRSANTHSVAQPFDLGPHTVFLVYRSGGNDRAFFRSETDPSRGVVLRGGGDHHRFQNGGTRDDQLRPYSRPTPLGTEFGITVLGRDSGKLKAFVDGEDVSSDAQFPESIRVGKLFHVRNTQYARVDGNGLWIAEMLFYKRYLDESERDAVTAYLADKYDLEAATAAVVDEGPAVTETLGRAAGLVQLSTQTDVDVNGAAVAVPWTLQDVLHEPFLHDTDGENTRLVCTLDDVLVRLYVSLPLTAEVDGAGVRVLFRVNGAKFLRGAGVSGPIGPATAGSKRAATVRAEVIARLNAGDYVEVVTIRDGAAGKVTIDRGMAVFIAEER